MRYIILLIIFICLVIYCNKQSQRQINKSNDYLINNIEFEGTITKLRISSNHAFGIIELKLTKSSIEDFDEKIKKGIYPYKIKGDTAELYCTVSIDRKIGDIVKVVSNEQTVYYNPQNSTEEGSLYIQTDPYNISFVNDNTLFK